MSTNPSPYPAASARQGPDGTGDAGGAPCDHAPAASTGVDRHSSSAMSIEVLRLALTEGLESGAVDVDPKIVIGDIIAKRHLQGTRR